MASLVLDPQAQLTTPRSTFPGYDSLLDRAKAWRLGDDAITFTAADGLACCELVTMVARPSSFLAGPA